MSIVGEVERGEESGEVEWTLKGENFVCDENTEGANTGKKEKNTKRKECKKETGNTKEKNEEEK